MTYNLALNAHILKASKGNDVIDSKACLELLEKMKKSPGSHPDKFSYTTVIHALTKSPTRMLKSNADTCLKLLNEMKTLGRKDLYPDAALYNAVLKSLSVVNESHEVVTDMCMRLFEEMKKSDKMQPDAVTYSAILSRLANTSEKGDAASVDRMIDFLREIGKDLNVIHYNIVMSSLVRRAETGDLSSADRILSLLGEMAVSENSAVRPDSVTYNTAINYMVKLVNAGDGGAAEKCLLLLREMSRSGEAATKPDVITYSTIMKAYAKLVENGDVSALTVSLALFDEMKREHIAPDIFTYSVVLQTLVFAAAKGHKPALEKSLEILEEMKSSDNPALRPNTIIYTKILNMLVLSSNQGDATAIDKALFFLDEMKCSPKSQPDVIAYSCVINALAKQIEKDNESFLAIDRIMALLSDMQSSPKKVAPNYGTYSVILSPLLKLVESGSPEAFSKVMQLLYVSQSSETFRLSASKSSKIDENPFLIKTLLSLRILANKNDDSVVTKTIAFLQAFDKHKIPCTSNELLRADHIIQTIFKAFCLPRPPGSTSELHRIDRPWKVAIIVPPLCTLLY
jgi:hypothetical protein